jgi:hypothetical protein
MGSFEWCLSRIAGCEQIVGKRERVGAPRSGHESDLYSMMRGENVELRALI